MNCELLSLVCIESVTGHGIELDRVNDSVNKFESEVLFKRRFEEI